MGKILTNGVKAVSKRTPGKSVSFRQLMLSVISLVIALIVLATATFSWFSIKTSDLEANDFKLDCGKGLRVNDSGTTDLSFHQDERYITPASSVDGRNLFFPTDGTDFSKVTSNMTFRSANAGDKNVNYIQIDFTLTAQQNHTALYINDDKTSIKVHDGGNWSTTKAGALRAALWSSTAENDGVPNTPIVFNPSASTVRTTAVADVDRSTGAYLSGGPQVAHAFSEYAFGGEPVATLSKSVATKFSYIIWLEGTDQKCTDKMLQKDIQINLAFSTSWDKTKTIRLKDETGTENSLGWVTDKIKNDHYSLTLHYVELGDNDVPTGSNTDFNMYDYIEHQDGEWMCNIPGDMRKNISFVLRPSSSSDDNTVYVFCVNSKTQGTDVADEAAYNDLANNKKTLDRGSNRQYIVDVPANTAYPAACRGYWKAIGDSDGSGHDVVGDLDGDDF